LLVLITGSLAVGKDMYYVYKIESVGSIGNIKRKVL